MPRVGYRAFYRAAKDNGYSEGQARRIARSIMARPDLDLIVEQLTLPDSRTYIDPTGEEAVWRVMHAALAQNELETTP